MYVAHLAHCDEVRTEIEELVRVSLPDALIVTGRTKSRDTLREKLQRSPTLQLPSIDDVIGVRVVGDLTLSEQDGVAATLGEVFSGALKVKDRRTEPVAGYRALHVIVRSRGLRAEVQVRTRLQAEWADLFERLADTWGRQIRYGLPPDSDWMGATEARIRHIEAIQHLSTHFIASYEQALSDHVPFTQPTSERRGRVRNLSRPALAAAMRVKEADKELARANRAVDVALQDFRIALLADLEDLARKSELIP